MTKERKNYQLCLNLFIKEKLKITCQEHIDDVKSYVSRLLGKRLKKIMNNTKSRYRTKLKERGEPKKTKTNREKRSKLKPNLAFPQ